MIIPDAEKTEGRVTLAGSARLLQKKADDSDPRIMNWEPARISRDCLQNAKLVPVLGTTNYLIRSGDIGLIGDPDVLSALTQRQVTAQIAIECQDIERKQGQEFIPD